MTIPSDAWIRTGLEITGHFENSADPWGGVTGDFDGMGVSLGVLQWNCGMGSLQPMVRRAGQPAVTATMPTIGGEFWSACQDGAGWRPLVMRWHQGGALKSAAARELKAFAKSAPFVAEQIRVSRQTAMTAMAMAESWAKHDPSNAVVGKALFCWFFDLATQNGGLKGLTMADVGAFRHSHPDAAAWLCGWLEQRAGSAVGGGDARANGRTWRAPVASGRRTLLILSYLRSLKSVAKWQLDVLNRKGTIAMWRGKVHGETHDFAALLG